MKGGQKKRPPFIYHVHQEKKRTLKEAIMKIFGREIVMDIKIPRFIGKLLSDKNKNNVEPIMIPSTNISDEEKAFELSLALPGLDKEDVSLEI